MDDISLADFLVYFILFFVCVDVMQVLPAMFCGQDLGNGPIPNYTCPNLFYRDVQVPRSPPWRPDDKDGHYVFAIGENLTARCKCLLVSTAIGFQDITSLNYCSQL